MFAKNDVELVTTFINLTYNIEVQNTFSCNNTPLWLQCVSNCLLVIEWEMSWITLLIYRTRLGYKFSWICGTDTLEYRLSRIWIDIGYSIQ